MLKSFKIHLPQYESQLSPHRPKKKRKPISDIGLIQTIGLLPRHSFSFSVSLNLWYFRPFSDAGLGSSKDPPSHKQNPPHSNTVEILDKKREFLVTPNFRLQSEGIQMQLHK